MDIIHHIVFAGSDQITEVINDLGIKYDGNPPSNIGVFDIAESNSRWPEVSRLVVEKDLPDVCYTLFTKEEVLSAEWLRVNVTFEQGYPQPEASWDRVTLDQDSECSKCRLWAIQKSNFQIKKEPRLGRKDFMSLFWTAIVLASMPVFEAFETAGVRGYEKWPILIRATQESAKSVAQIRAVRQTKPGLLDMSGLRTEVCRQCGRVKFNRVMKGRIRYRRDAFPPDVDFVLSHEWFGSGGMAFQELFVSNRVARVVVDHGWKGLLLDPIELL